MKTIKKIKIEVISILLLTSLFFSCNKDNPVSVIDYWKLTTVNSGSLDNLLGIYFIDENTGFISGDNSSGNPSGTLLITNDGGATWTSKAYNFHGGSCIYFINNFTGFIATSTSPYNGIYKTTDNGNTWVSIDHSGVDFVKDIKFMNDNIGIAVGDYGILRSTNLGLNWSSIISNTGISFYSIDNSDTNNCITAGTNGNAIAKKSSDGGQNWSNLSISPVGKFTSVEYTDSQTVYVCGYDNGSQNGFIYKSINNGSSWSNSNISSALLESWDFSDNLHGVGLCGSFYYTINGGNSWNSQNLNTSSCRVVMLNSNKAIAIGNNGYIAIISKN